MGALAGMMGGAGAGAAGAGAAGATAAGAGAAAGGSSLLSGLGNAMIAGGTGSVGGVNLGAGSDPGTYQPGSLDRRNQTDEQRKQALMAGLKTLSR